MKPLSIEECLLIYSQVMESTGGKPGIRDLGALESSLATIWQSFSGHDLYPDLAEKAAMLAFFTSANHPFLDGNKRASLAFSELFLWKNGFELDYSQKKKVALMMRLARGELSKEQLIREYKEHVVPMTS